MAGTPANLLAINNDTGTFGLQLQATVPVGAGPFNYDVSIPPGVYYVTIGVFSNLTGVTSSVTIFPFIDNTQTIVGGGLFLTAPGLTAATTILFTAGVLNTTIYGASTGATVPSYQLVFPFGFRVQFARGTAVNAEACLLVAYMTRIV